MISEIKAAVTYYYQGARGAGGCAVGSNGQGNYIKLFKGDYDKCLNAAKEFASLMSKNPDYRGVTIIECGAWTQKIIVEEV